ncbi:SCO family protein [Sphingomonas sp.]
MNGLLRTLPLALAFAAAACSGAAPPEEPPLAGARIGGAFTLTGSDGQPVSDRDFAGQWRIHYFGYTFCPDVCPVDMRNIGAGLKLFEQRAPALAAKVTPIFITVDPERDTPPVVGQFVANFHPRAVGLTGTPEQIASISKQFAIYAAKQPSPDPRGYLVDHARITYLLDHEGKPIAMLPADDSPEAVADALAKWVR